MLNIALITEYCEVIDHGYMFGVEYIWYREDDMPYGTLETYDPIDGVHEMFSCDSKEDFDLIMSMI